MDYLHVFIFMFLSIHVDALSQEGLSHEERLFKFLFDGYDKRIRPVKNHTDAVDLTMVPKIISVLHMDVRAQIFRVNIWIEMGFKNEFLIWEPENFGGIDLIKVPVHDLWIPDIILYNNAGHDLSTSGEILSKDSNVLCLLDNEGNIFLVPTIIMSSSCQVDISKYPFDTQSCRIIFGSWVYTSNEIYLRLGNHKLQSLIDKFKENQEWHLLDMKCEIILDRFSYFGNNKTHSVEFPKIHCTVNIRRRALFYILNIVIPTIFLVVIGSLTFCLAPDCGERLSLAITVLLAMIVFLLVVMENMPATSRTIPLIEWYVLACMGLLGGSTAFTALLMNLKSRQDSGEPVPLNAGKYLLSHNDNIDMFSEKLVDIRQASQEDQINDQQPSSRERNPEEKKQRHEALLNMEWQQFIVFLNRLMGLFYCIALICVTVVFAIESL